MLVSQKVNNSLLKGTHLIVKTISKRGIILTHICKYKINFYIYKGKVSLENENIKKNFFHSEP